MIHISSEIKRLRETHNLTQQMLADYCNVSKATVSKWERGKSYPDITQLPKIAQRFSVTVDELLNYRKDISKEEMRKRYEHFYNRISKEDYEHVLEDIKREVYEFYHHHEYVNLLSTLLVNTLHLNESKKVGPLILEWTDHVLENSNDVTEVETAFALQIIVHDYNGESELIVEKLKDTVKPKLLLSPVLAKNYYQLNEFKQADAALQVDTYQNLLSLLDNLNTMLTLPEVKPNEKEEIIHRISSLEAFNIRELEPSRLVKTYLLAAIHYASKEDKKHALHYLNLLKETVKHLLSNFTLHGDSFFNLIDEWLDDLPLGQSPPMNSREVVMSIQQALHTHPAFHLYKDDMDFKNVLYQLDKLKEEASYGDAE